MANMTDPISEGTMRRGLIAYVIEQRIVVSTASIERIEPGADASRRGAFSDERPTVERSNDRHKV